ncbi:MAG: Rieske (2Fe-2S) protein [Chitinophagaceae bacterium]|nr:MAG: Rieske (2Fe-2S) protein [Chitinophagaceae bacterium]
MHRKDFIKKCGFACVGVGTLSLLLPGCVSSKTINGKISGDEVIIPLSDFETSAGNEKNYKKYLVFQNDILQYPICVYRHNENEYSALWMRCSHQGAELQVFGDKLQCPAHGSEFGNKGDVQNGPAENKLRTFAVTVGKNQLHISLKAI